MAITIQIDGISSQDAAKLSESLANNPGRMFLSGDIKDVSVIGKSVSVEIGGSVELKVNPPVDPIEAELLS